MIFVTYAYLTYSLGIIASCPFKKPCLCLRCLFFFLLLCSSDDAMLLFLPRWPHLSWQQLQSLPLISAPIQLHSSETSPFLHRRTGQTPPLTRHGAFTLPFVLLTSNSWTVSLRNFRLYTPKKKSAAGEVSLTGPNFNFYPCVCGVNAVCKRLKAVRV